MSSTEEHTAEAPSARIATRDPTPGARPRVAPSASPVLASHDRAIRLA
jgi:hypothetical protein